MGDTPRYLIVGAGLTGAVIARILADAGFHCDVVDEADHVAGHCHTSRDSRTGILVHRFGPHTLHTDDAEIWAFLEQFVEIRPFGHKKQAWAGGAVYPLPINLETLSLFFGETFTPETARDYVAREAVALDGEPSNFEDAALSRIGRRLYDAFYRGYTTKQWGRQPTDIPAFVFGRLPIHFNNERNVFHHSRQGQPVGGYTHMVERMLDHDNIRVTLNRSFDPAAERAAYRHIFYSGPIDRYFNHRFGRLAYRTLDFEFEHGVGFYQQCGSVNHCDLETPYTRVAEHKHFWEWEQHEETVYSFEFSRECGEDDTPYYPIPLIEENKRYMQYVALAQQESGVSFVGRLGTYRYIDMDVAIGEAMKAGKIAIAALGEGAPLPHFFVQNLNKHG